MKLELDQRRRNILPTVELHHQLKTIASDRVDIAERQLSDAPQRLEELSARLRPTYWSGTIGGARPSEWSM